ncbi:MAG: 2,3,4,5-tetrahydropyridine-2,6-dicarboxylate N-succinyltransferase, partial [Haloquadratum sp.]|nr:2,3,4,5-tetrahydropyridine-2,6-dicarboxylate N-succinyltransferase [Haloquadratum sp.]
GAHGWRVNTWVKQGILLTFATGEITAHTHGGVTYNDVLPLAATEAYADRGTRNTPDGTVVRRGAHIGASCILMSPSFVNIGAHVGDGTLVDSCDTVGSCAQVGAGVKLGANTAIGGVLEPIEDAPVILEDGVSLGAGCRVTSGFHIGRDTIVAEGVLCSPRLPVYDLVDEEVRYGYIPPERRVFTRYVPSSIGTHPLFEDSGAFKPAMVALDVAAETLDRTQREELLRG